jgi:hypothetical protein
MVAIHVLKMYMMYMLVMCICSNIHAHSCVKLRLFTSNWVMHMGDMFLPHHYSFDFLNYSMVCLSVSMTELKSIFNLPIDVSRMVG